MRKWGSSCSAPILSRSSFGDDRANSSAFRPIRSGSRRGRSRRDPSTSKWVLYFIMQATTTNVRNLAGKYAVILDGLMQDQVEVSAVAARIQELGGVDAGVRSVMRGARPSSSRSRERGRSRRR